MKLAAVVVVSIVAGLFLGCVVVMFAIASRVP